MKGCDVKEREIVILNGARTGIALGQSAMGDYLWESLVDSYNKMPMVIMAENLVVRYNITREESDTFSLRSQKLAKEARDAGRLSEEIVPVEVTIKKGKTMIVSKDEHHPRPETTVEGLAKLSPVFKKDGVVTAGSVSGICDGAAAVVVMAKDEADRLGLSILENWSPTAWAAATQTLRESVLYPRRAGHLLTSAKHLAISI